MNRKQKAVCAYTHTHTHTSRPAKLLRAAGRRCMQWVSAFWGDIVAVKARILS